jgi:hypothetical protein
MTVMSCHDLRMTAVSEITDQRLFTGVSADFLFGRQVCYFGGVIDKDATVVEAEVELVELAELTIAVVRARKVSADVMFVPAPQHRHRKLYQHIFGSGPRRS